mmetsp:Transcript_42093/g.111109  ORF Transcript_42093/g.111109 Transcript_42093/m.111109 type:complete len:286 (-) Transcript_42093:63-920(-)
MSKQMKGTGLAAAGIALYGGCQAFVPSARAPTENAQFSALRGSGAVREQLAATVGPSSLTSGLVGMLGAGAVGAALAVGKPGRSRAMAVPCYATAVTGAAKASEADAPPAPPPFDPSKQLGVTAPMGFFDPAGFCKVGDEKGFRKLRIAEMKHGRVAMLASVGAVIQPMIQLPGFEKVPKGLSAFLYPPGTYGFVSLVLVCGAAELGAFSDGPNKDLDSIGDYGAKGNPLQLTVGATREEFETMRNRELNNGRAAMIATLGIIVAELATGKNGLEQLGYIQFPQF